MRHRVIDYLQHAPQGALRNCYLRPILLIAPFIFAASSAVASDSVKVPFIQYETNRKYIESNPRSGWTTSFQDGAPEENGKKAEQGELRGEIYKPTGVGPFAFVVMMHGCGGMAKSTNKWARDWSEFFTKRGIGTLVLDSFTTRQVTIVCNKPAAYWARRRTDDAYSALDYLVTLPFVKADEVYVMGESNGGRTVLNVVQLLMNNLRNNHFAGGIALYPTCSDHKGANFYAPLYIFLGSADNANPPADCQTLVARPRSADHPELKAFEYVGAVHEYDIDFPYREFLGWKLYYNKDAALDTQKQIIELINRRQASTN